MPDEALKPALRRALKLHEIGDRSPYQLFFAGKGKSGASFGFMQGDMAAGQPIVQQTFRRALQAAGLSAPKIEALARPLSQHTIGNPLGPADTRTINAALASPQGKELVDVMDEMIATEVYDHLDRCLAAAAKSGRTIASKAQLYMALWINMSGPPSTLLTWLGGKAVAMSRLLPKPPMLVDGEAMEAYLQATAYYTENPGNLPHMLHCVAAGMEALVTG